MKTVLEDISSVKKKLLVEVQAEDVNKKLDGAYRTLKNSAKIPGFRPGKIPRNILERYYGKQVIEDVTRDLVSETLPKAVEEVSKVPLTMPVIENEPLKAGQSFRYSAVMEVRPDFELGDYKGIEIEKEIGRITDDDVNRQLEEIRKSHGKLIPVDEDRGVNIDDYVVVDYEGFEGDKPIKDIQATNFLIRMGKNDFHPEFEKALMGRKKGETSQAVISFEATHHHAKLAGKNVIFRIKVTDIKKLELPELNDAFAEGLGADVKNITELREKLRDELIKRDEARIDREMRQRLIRKISDGIDFELPESLVKHELDVTVENIRQNLARSGSNFERAGLSEDRLRKELAPASEKKVKEKLILGEIARQNSLTINDLELSEGFREAALSMGQEPGVLRQYYEANGLVESFRAKLLEEKTLNYLVKSANITQIEADKMNPEPDAQTR